MESARQALRNPFVTAEVVAILVDAKQLHGSVDLRRDLTAHPLTPPAFALRIVQTLYWRDLARIGLDTKAPPIVRRAAEQIVVTRLPSLTLGERISLARMASAGIFGELRRDNQPRVIAALLDNPRMTEGALSPLVANRSASPEVLRVIASSPRWGRRYPIRLALCRNPNTPLALSTRIVSTLLQHDIEGLIADKSVPQMVRVRAKELSKRR